MDGTKNNDIPTKSPTIKEIRFQTSSQVINKIYII